MRILVMIALLLPSILRGAGPYFIDSDAANDSADGLTDTTPWKRAPGMSGFAGTYTHANGDVFYFKRGKTWVLAASWGIANSGALGNEDIYRSHPTWGGASAAQAAIDGGGASLAAGTVSATAKHNIKFIDLSFNNQGLTGQDGSSGPTMINFLECTNITFLFTTNAPYCQRFAYFHYDTAGRYAGPYFISNDVSHCGSMLWHASSTAGVIMDGLLITRNHLHDGTSQIGGTSPNGIHGDGLVHGYSVPNDSSDQYHTNAVLSYNLVDGDWRRSYGNDGAMTSFYYFEDWVHGIAHNNIYAPSPVAATMAGSFVNIGGSNPLLWFDWTMANETIINNGTSSASAGILISPDAAGTAWRITIRNCIVDGLQYAISVEQTGGTYDGDYNCFDSNSGQFAWGGSLQSYATWQGAGRDTHSVLGSDPLVVNAASDFHLQSGSPCRDTGTTVASATPDYFGISRPQGSAYDIGAAEYDSGVPPTVTQAPPKLRWQRLRR